MKRTYDSVAEIYQGIATLRDRLLDAGASEAAAELSGVISSSWSTASEAVGEARLSLERVKPDVEVYLPQAKGILDALIEGARELWG